MEQQMFNNTSILAWLTYYAEHTQVDLRKVKILDITRKNKNVIPTVESHNNTLVFTDTGHPDIFYGTNREVLLGEPFGESCGA